MRVRHGLAAMVLAAVALAGTGCGDDGGPAAGPVDVSQQLAVPPDAEAVELRAKTASLFEETVFLVVDATQTGARAGFDSERHRAATEELRHTTEEVVDTVSPLFDEGGVDRFSREYSELVELARGYGREQLQPEFRTRSSGGRSTSASRRSRLCWRTAAGTWTPRSSTSTWP